MLFPESDFHESASLPRQTKLTCFQINSIGEQIQSASSFVRICIWIAAYWRSYIKRSVFGKARIGSCILNDKEAAHSGALTANPG